MKRLLILPLAGLLFHMNAPAQLVVKMNMPPQSQDSLSAVTLFDEILPLDIPSVLSPLGYDIDGGTPPYNYQWYENEDLLSNDSTVMLVPSAGNDYSLVVSDSNHCSVTLLVKTETSTAVDEGADQESVLQAWYSTENNTLRIRFLKEVTGEVRLQLLDLKGVSHHSTLIRGDAAIPLDLETGFYLLAIRGVDFRYVMKIVIP